MKLCTIGHGDGGYGLSMHILSKELGLMRVH